MISSFSNFAAPRAIWTPRAAAPAPPAPPPKPSHYNRNLRMAGAMGGAVVGAAGLGYATAGLSGTAATVAGSLQGGVAIGAAGLITVGLLGAWAGRKMGDNPNSKGLGQMAGMVVGSLVGGLAGTITGLVVGAHVGVGADNILGIGAGLVAGGAIGLYAAHRATKKP